MVLNCGRMHYGLQAQGTIIDVVDGRMGWEQWEATKFVDDRCIRVAGSQSPTVAGSRS